MSVLLGVLRMSFPLSVVFTLSDTTVYFLLHISLYTNGYVMKNVLAPYYLNLQLYKCLQYDQQEILSQSRVSEHTMSYLGP